MSIKLNNFVDIDIKYEDASSYSATRDTAVLILFDSGEFINDDFDITFSSKESIEKEYTETGAKTKEGFYTQYKIYFESFFNNMGRNLRIIAKGNSNSTANDIKNIIDSLDDEYIVIASNAGFETMKAVATLCEQIEGTSQKLILGYCPNETHLKEENTFKSLGINKFIVKYGNESYTEEKGAIPCEASNEVTSDTEIAVDKKYGTRTESSEGAGYLNDGTYAYTLITEGNPHELNAYEITNEGADAVDFQEDTYCQGIEMSIAGYLTNIDINRYDSVQDYSFTQEVYDNETLLGNYKTLLNTITIDDNELAKSLLNININFIGNLLGKSRNLGGNDSDEYSIINMFMLICLHQTLSEKLTDLIVTKIKYNQTGLAQISAVLNKELQKYVDNGYLTTNKTWTNEDLYYKNTLVIKQNTPLSLGYRYVILPFSSLKSDEITKKQLPDIYILIADSYGIRKINVFGKTY